MPLLRFKSAKIKQEHILDNQIWKEKKCYLCGRKYPETVLNIEGMIHHHERTRCIDIKTCNKVRKKNERKTEKKRAS